MQMPSAVRTEKTRGRFSRRGLCEPLRQWEYAGDLPDVSNAGIAQIDGNPRKAAAERCCRYRGDLPDVSNHSATHRPFGLSNLMRIGF